MKKIFTIAIMLCLLFIATACAKSEIEKVPPPTTNPTPSTDLAGYTECKDPRPEICTMEYMPVCAYGSNGTNYTAGNKCSACGDKGITGYVENACPGDEDQNVQPPIGGDTDNHGCLIAAGYSWCDAKNKCIRSWEENCSTADATKEYVECKTPRPQMCTREYNPVCAKVDTGIRCIKAPCPSEEWQTFATGCTACSDSKVYGYVLGECQNTQPTEPTKPSAKLMAPKALCKTAEEKASAAQNGYNCVDSCPADKYMTQMGLEFCIDHYGKTEALAMTTCTKSSDCPSEHSCAYVLAATDGNIIDWAKSQLDSNKQPIDALRCVPGYYTNFAINGGGLYSVDENGKLSVAIA